MATLPNLAQQPQPGVARLNIGIDPEKVSIVIDLGNGASITQALDNAIMLNLFVNFMKLHPELVSKFLKQVREAQSQEMDIIRTVNSTKNG